MTSPMRRFLLVVSFVVLVAASCSSSADDQAVATDAAIDATTPDDSEDQSTTETGAEGGDADASDTESAATSIPVPDDDSAAEAAIAGLDGDAEAPPEAPTDRRTTAQDFVRSRFNIDPEAEWVSCMVGQSPRDDVLDMALQSAAVGRGEVDDTQLRSLTFAMNGCVDTIGLGDWATQAIGPQGEVQQTAPACFAEQFDDPETGDITFYTFVSLTYQFRLDPAGADSLVEALTTCAPITSLGEFFAGQAEQASNFETVIDRACLETALSPIEVSQDFWETFVAGGRPPADVITPYTDSCAEAPNADLASEAPVDFVPWAGTRALADVVPSARAGIYTAPPPMALTPGASYEAVLATGGGEIRIKLYPETAPITVNNFVSLALDGYYDGTIFHRVLADFMAQGGDPTGTGSGGPGYQFQDEVDGGPALDRKGLLAMANAGPGTNGSQFFITFVPTEWLTGNHTVFGEVVEGIEIVDAIELRDPSAPSSRGQVIESVTIIES